MVLQIIQFLYKRPIKVYCQKCYTNITLDETVIINKRTYCGAYGKNTSACVELLEIESNGPIKTERYSGEKIQKMIDKDKKMEETDKLITEFVPSKLETEINNLLLKDINLLPNTHFIFIIKD